ncbi:IS element transposase [Caballeronia udeis]|uniref:IS element transposase n=2 Tax=Caballeronia udeis TaxID=1232866 RepID=A0A158JU31_9BURK|nr:IS element transposase [Caballeronia udeis]
MSYAVWLYYCFPLNERMVVGTAGNACIELTYETVQRWTVKFGLSIARRIRFTTLGWSGKWDLDEVVVTINSKRRWLWRAVDQHGVVLDLLAQSRRQARCQDAHAQAAKEVWVAARMPTPISFSARRRRAGI